MKLFVVLMLFSLNVMAYQYEVSVVHEVADPKSVEFSIEDTEFDKTSAQLRYYLNDIVDTALPYALQPLVSDSNYIDAVYSVTELTSRIVGSDTYGVTDGDVYGLSGKLYLSNSSYFVGIGYEYHERDHRVVNQQGVYVEQVYVRGDMLGFNSETDGYFVMLGYDIDKMTELSLALNRKESNSVNFIGSMTIDTAELELRYQKIISGNSFHFLYGAGLSYEEYELRLGGLDLGFDEDSWKLMLFADWFLTRHTSLMLQYDRVDTDARDYDRDADFLTVGVEHFVGPNFNVSFRYTDEDRYEWTTYQLSIGYRF